MNMEDMYVNKEGVFSSTMMLLNMASVDRTVSKHEAMCFLGQLPLFLCSERIEPVSLSPSRHISNQKEATKVEDTSWVTEYKRRTGDSTVCFHHYMTGEMNAQRPRHRNKYYLTTMGPYNFFPLPYQRATVIKYY
jgi:hypothetical protein